MREAKGRLAMSTFSRQQLWILNFLWLVALLISGFEPLDRATWWMEVLPVLIAGPLLLLTARSFPLPRYIYIWIFLHGLVLIVGGHYTYAEVPVGFWVQEALGWSRNPFDRLGHLLQGFVPALVIREILVRFNVVTSRAWLFLLTVTCCMAISVTYEFIEWWAALLLGQGAEAFLGTQGDPWDTQWDMFLATVGAILAQIFYSSKRMKLVRS